MKTRPAFFFVLVAAFALIFLGHPNQRVDGYFARDAIASECR